MMLIAKTFIIILLIAFVVLLILNVISSKLDDRHNHGRICKSTKELMKKEGKLK